jgi:hypothetical protein
MQALSQTFLSIFLSLVMDLAFGGATSRLALVAVSMMMVVYHFVIGDGFVTLLLGVLAAAVCKV